MDKICYRNPIEVGCHWPSLKKPNDHAEPTNSNAKKKKKKKKFSILQLGNIKSFQPHSTVCITYNYIIIPFTIY